MATDLVDPTQISQQTFNAMKMACLTQRLLANQKVILLRLPGTFMHFTAFLLICKLPSKLFSH